MNHSKRLALCAAFAITLGLVFGGVLVSGARASSVDIVANFSGSNNPNGDFSYGETSGLGGAFGLLSTQINSSGETGWTTGSGFPAIYHNSTNADFTSGSVFVPLAFVNMHPDNSGNDAVVQYTIPSTGSYTISGKFQGNDVDGTTTDVHILLNNSVASSLLSGEITGPMNLPTNQVSFDITQAFTAGDTIDFVVGFGIDGSYVFDTTGLQGTITENSATTPEPHTFVLALGAILLIFASRHRLM